MKLRFAQMFSQNVAGSGAPGKTQPIPTMETVSSMSLMSSGSAR